MRIEATWVSPYPRARKAGATEPFTIFMYPPPASFLCLTMAKSGSTPVVSTDMAKPMVPVGARQLTCMLRRPCWAPASIFSGSLQYGVGEVVETGATECGVVEPDGDDVQVLVGSQVGFRKTRPVGGPCVVADHLLGWTGVALIGGARADGGEPARRRWHRRCRGGGR